MTERLDSSQYHLRRHEKEITDAAVITGLLENGRFVTIALCRDGEPYIVTLSYGYDAQNNRLYFHCAHDGDKIAFIAANPQACATVIDDRGYIMGQCDHHFRSLVIRGHMSNVSDPEELEHGLHILIEQLEVNPDAVMQRMVRRKSVFKKMAILRFDIQSVTAKQNG